MLESMSPLGRPPQPWIRVELLSFHYRIRRLQIPDVDRPVLVHRRDLPALLVLIRGAEELGHQAAVKHKLRPPNRKSEILISIQYF